MAQLASIATLVGTGASIYNNVSQANARNDAAKSQMAAMQAAQQAEARKRSDTLARTLATARARAGASGTGSADGSTAALLSGLEQDAAKAQSESDSVFRARMAAGRSSLLGSDGTFTSYLRAGQTASSALRSLLD